MFSLLGVTMQYKFCAWAGATFALAAFLNKRKHDSDSSQTTKRCKRDVRGTLQCELPRRSCVEYLACPD